MSVDSLEPVKPFRTSFTVDDVCSLRFTYRESLSFNKRDAVDTFEFGDEVSFGLEFGFFPGSEAFSVKRSDDLEVQA